MSFQTGAPIVTATGEGLGAAVINALHSGPDKIQKVTTQFLSPSFNSLTLSQVRLKINDNEMRIVQLKQQIQPLPAKQGDTRRVKVGSRRIKLCPPGRAGGTRCRIRFDPIFADRFFESAQSKANRNNITRENNEINSQISKLNTELTQLKNQEKVMIELSNLVEQEQQKTDEREELFNLNLFQINPQVQEKKTSNIPLIAGLGIIGVALLG